MGLDFEIENIGGIRRGAAELRPGVNVVQGRNWQGKSSLIAALEAAMGTDPPLTEGAEQGRVELDTGEETFVSEFVRSNGETVRKGEGYLTDEQDRIAAELFAFLDDSNPVRRAVRRGADLEEYLTRPLDFENIDEQIAQHKRELEQVETELERARNAAGELPGVEERINRLEAELQELREERDELAGGEQTGDDTVGRREELSDVRAERDSVRDRISRLEDTTARTRERLEERRIELEELEVPDQGEVASRLADVHDDLDAVERDMELLQSVYEANRRVLEEDRLELLTEVEHGLAGNTLTCWVCGNASDRESFTSRLESLREEITSLREQAETYREQVNDLEEKRDSIRGKHRLRDDLEAEIATLEETLAEREESLETARDRYAQLDDRVEELSAAVEEADSRLTDIESEIKYTERELEEAREERESLESRADRRQLLEEEREALVDDIETLRTRKETVKRRTREAFDDAMQDILERFDVGFESARLTSTFELVVARDGRVAGLDALSEGEVELLGIVTALAGHRAFEVHDRVPLLLLDSLGSLSKSHLHTLVEYLQSRSEYLVLTAYPEHGAFEGQEIDPSRWSIVSDDGPQEAAP